MKLKFETCHRGLLLVLGIVLLWSLLASAQTVTNAPDPEAVPTNHQSLKEHFERLDARVLTFGLDRIPFLREQTFLTEPLWKYIASVIYIFLAFYAAKLIDLLLFVWLRKLAVRTETKFDDLLLELLHGPVKLMVFVVFLHIGLTLFDWSAIASRYLSRGLILIVAASLTYVVLRILDLVLDLWRTVHAHEADARFNDQLFSVLRKSLKVFVVVVAVLVTASNIGINITAAITSLSIGGLAVGLAAQDTLANLFGAVAIFADKPFRVGDQIKLDVAEGTVEAVGMRSTRVRNADGFLVTIPNKTVGNAAITNISRRPNMRTTMNFALPHKLPAPKIQRALAILDEVYRQHPRTKDVWVSFNQFAGANINIMVVYWWKGTDQKQFLADMQQMNLAVKERFDEEGIAFA